MRLNWRRRRDVLRQWIRWRGNPRRAACGIAKRHHLQIAKELYGRSSAAVVQVVGPSGDTQVLKLESRRGQADSEYRALSAWRSSELVPAAQLLEPGVLLLEYVYGSRLSARGRPATAELQTVATLLRNLHIRAEGDYPDLWRHVEKRHSTIAATRRLSAPTRAIADEAHHALAELPRERFLLHGDLHAANIILTNDRATVIDPYGLVGDRAYDIAFVAVTSPVDQERVLAALGHCYGVALNGLTAWFRWLAVYRLDNAMRNGLPTTPTFQALVERLIHQPFPS